MTAREGGDSPLAVHRHGRILAQLREHGQVNSNALAESLGVTHETVRKDLVMLQERGLLARVHGGAVPVEAATLVQELPMTARTGREAQKRAIVREALQFVPDTGAMLFDSGTTTLALAAAVGPATVTAVTNSLPVAAVLLPKVSSLTMLGGRVRRETEATVERWATERLAAMRVDIAFLGTNAFSLEHGLATPDQAEAEVKAASLAAARVRVLLADSSKYGLESVFGYARLADIDVLVTDEGLTRDDAAAITQTCGVEVVRAAV